MLSEQSYVHSDFLNVVSKSEYNVALLICVLYNSHYHQPLSFGIYCKPS